MDSVREPLRDGYAVLARAYPEGLPDADYPPLLAALAIDMSHRGVAELVSAFTGRDYHLILNDVRGAVSPVQQRDNPPRDEVARVWERLLAHGWIPDEPLPRYVLPGFVEQAAAVLRDTYPDGLSDEDYPGLVAALGRDIDQNALTYAVTAAFPERDPVRVFGDAVRPSEVPAAEADRVWQNLLAHGWLPSTPG